MRRCTRRSRWGATRRTCSPSPTRTLAGPRGPHLRRRPRAAVALGREAREAAIAALHAVGRAAAANHRGQPSPVIASIVSAMATQLDLPETEIDRIRIAALLHDVGKVAVPEEILEKPAPLTSASGGPWCSTRASAR